MKKINILQLITGLGMGGAEKVVFNLANKIDKKQFNTYVLSISKRDELIEEFLTHNINTTILNRSNNIVDFFLIIKEIYSFIKKYNINIIHAHMTHACIIASILKILNPDIKIVYTSHSFNIGSKFREILIWLLKSLRDIDIIFSKDILKFFYKKNYRVIPNGIEIDKYKLDLPKHDKFTFIAVGRLEEMKNHQNLIKIANKLKNNYDFEIHIIGKGYLRKELEALIKKHNLQDRVKLYGLRRDIPVLLNKAHCLVMPSLWEGLPIVILEAAASSLPIISTKVGSIPSVLNSSNSYVCNLEEFECNMIDVMNNYNKAQKKAKILFKEIEVKYSIQSIVIEHEKIYLEI